MSKSADPGVGAETVQIPDARGVGRVAGNPKEISVYFDRELTDDELRALHTSLDPRYQCASPSPPEEPTTRECTCIEACGQSLGSTLGANWHCRVERERAERASPPEDAPATSGYTNSPEHIRNLIELLRARDLEMPEFHAHQLPLANMLDYLNFERGVLRAALVRLHDAADAICERADYALVDSGQWARLGPATDEAARVLCATITKK